MDPSQFLHSLILLGYITERRFFAHFLQARLHADSRCLLFDVVCSLHLRRRAAERPFAPTLPTLLQVYVATDAPNDLRDNLKSGVRTGEAVHLHLCEPSISIKIDSWNRYSSIIAYGCAGGQVKPAKCIASMPGNVSGRVPSGPFNEPEGQE